MSDIGQRLKTAESDETVLEHQGRRGQLSHRGRVHAQAGVRRVAQRASYIYLDV